MYHKNVELLAPAGSFDALRAAVNAGADAVYLGGSAFGARAYAANFNQEELLKAIEYTHIRRKKLYLTINTLFKERELEEQLFGYLAPFYEAGLDAVIVQDIGAFRLIRECFPGLAVHASTQMAVTGVYSAALLKEMGAARIVPARELQLQDIRAIVDAVEIEMECFVHGALCYCYSGQCLMSSMLGARSGNRGRCAQPCRMKYGKNYPLSLKDICTLEWIPQLVENGIDSFKIEGRMKSPEYVAGVVCVYRKYLDTYLQGRHAAEYRVDEEDIRALQDLYNRGGFSGGYLFEGWKPDNKTGKMPTEPKGRSMVALDRPNHQGTAGLSVTAAERNHQGCMAYCKALEPLNAGDVFELDADFNYTLGTAYAVGEAVTLRLPKNFLLSKIKPGTILYRTRNKALLDSLRARYLDTDIKIAISGAVFLQAEEPIRLTVWLGETCVTAEGAQVQHAQNQPLRSEIVRQHLKKTNDTPFVFQELTVEMGENLFLPLGALNELRRNALAKLENALVDIFWRTDALCESHRQDCRHKDSQKMDNQDICSRQTEKITGRQRHGQSAILNVLLDYPVRRMDLIRELAENKNVCGIYLDESAYKDTAFLAEDIAALQKAGKNVYISLPYVVKGRTVQRLERRLKELVACRDAMGVEADAFLLRNLESAALLQNMLPDAGKILDTSLYVMNHRAAQEYRRYLNNILYTSVPYELNYAELKTLGIGACELTVYGYIPVMLSENCVEKTLAQCSALNVSRMIRDTKNRSFRVQARCRDCYNVVYHQAPFWLFDRSRQIAELNPHSFRLHFSTEDSTMIKSIVDTAAAIADSNKTAEARYRTTHGHFDSGVE